MEKENFTKESDHFHSPSLGKVSFKKMVEEIKKFIQEDSRYRYAIYIGTDSKGNGRVHFVSAVLVHRIGWGGIYFWKEENKEHINSLRHKIFQEALFSLDLAREIVRALRREKEMVLHEDFEIHIDIGENGPTKDLINEIIGFVKANGFEAKTKPEACASSVADWYA